MSENGMNEIMSIEEWPECWMLEIDYQSSRHWDNSTELLFVLCGEIKVNIEKREWTVKAGQGLCICAGAMHMYLRNQTNARGIVAKFSMDILARVMDARSIKKLYDRVFVFQTDSHMLETACEMATSGFGEYTKYVRTASLLIITSRLLADPLLISDVWEWQKQGNREYLRAAQEYMVKNAASPLTLKMLADHLGITTNYCSRYIKEKTGMTFVSYLNRLRLNRAEYYLTYTDRSITEIADRCGFNSIQTFNRVFKNMLGVTPKEYRKTQKRN